MRRREFIRNSTLASIAAGGQLGLPGLGFAQSCPVVDLPRTVVNVMLQGGADFRFMFMPSPGHADSDYVDMIWAARQAIYDSAYQSYQEMFDSEYDLVTDPLAGLQFGIHAQAGWLRSEFEAGRVAVVANAFCSRNRRHDQSILNADAGEPEMSQLIFDRDGWGGRLVEQIDGAPNVVELGQRVSVFSKGSMPGSRLGAVVHAEDMRDMALAGVDSGAAGSRRNVLARALHGWYEARGVETAAEQPANWPYHMFFQHRAALQEFGLQIQARLDVCGVLPGELEELSLNNPEFALQCRNLYDACQLPDILNQRVMSMSYGGWDSHDNQHSEITGNLADLFGGTGGLATALPLVAQLPYNEVPALDNLVFYFASDFGRQLLANGTAGTDHGSGTYSIVLGTAVQGGLYGEVFPGAEAQNDGQGQIPLLTQGADITGLTSTERILANISDWCEAGTSAGVVPGAAGADAEIPGLLDGLLAT